MHYLRGSRFQILKYWSPLWNIRNVERKILVIYFILSTFLFCPPPWWTLSPLPRIITLNWLTAICIALHFNRNLERTFNNTQLSNCIRAFITVVRLIKRNNFPTSFQIHPNNNDEENHDLFIIRHFIISQSRICCEQKVFVGQRPRISRENFTEVWQEDDTWSRRDVQ